MTMLARLGVAAVVVKRDKGKWSEGVRRERGRAMGRCDVKGEGLHRHVVAELHYHRRVVAFIIPSLSPSLVLRRGQTKLEEREDIAGSPAEQGGKPPPPSTDVAEPYTSHHLGFLEQCDISHQTEFGFFGVIVEKLTDKSPLLPLYKTVHEIFTSYDSQFNSFQVIGSFSSLENLSPSFFHSIPKSSVVVVGVAVAEEHCQAERGTRLWWLVSMVLSLRPEEFHEFSCYCCCHWAISPSQKALATAALFWSPGNGAVTALVVVVVVVVVVVR
ncbi:hypothetical protein PIB30_091482 [Stylosanthes scabra]|uniref:Uncharacterized protein n=1 Tax=Stylosanthes scabra TaxID=79078 RepID=A0ABU6RVH0_9FABA|nr:hypothetical protein [Stylosanthes scabra]